MGEPGSSDAPAGVTVDDVDWLASGARSGIVRVQGARPADSDVALPILVVAVDGDEHRIESLPDTTLAGAEGWRGAYVVEAGLALSASDLAVEWRGGERWSLGPLGDAPPAAAPAAPAVPHLTVVEDPTGDESPAPDVPVSGETASTEPGIAESPAASGLANSYEWPDLENAGADVVDRAVLAERRAGRSEAAAKIHQTMALDALRAVEALELRSAALAQDLEAAWAERDSLRARVEPGAPVPPSPRETALERTLAERQAEVDALRAAAVERETAPLSPDEEAERRAAALTQALTEAIAEVDGLRLELHEQLLLRRTRDVEAGADRVALVTLAGDLDGLRAAADAARAEAVVIVEERDAARVSLDHQRAETAGALAAHDETRRRFTERVAELREARERVGTLEAELAGARDEAERVQVAHAAELIAVTEAHADELALARDAAETAAADAADRLAVAQAEAARNAERAADVERMQAEVARSDAALRRAEVAREAAVASALAARAQRQVAAVVQAGAGADRVAALEGELEVLRARLTDADPGGGLGTTGSGLGAAAAQREELLGNAPPIDEPAVPGPVPAPPDVIARAAEQVRLAAERRAAEPADTGRLLANLDAAAAALRQTAPPAPTGEQESRSGDQGDDSPPSAPEPAADPPEPPVPAADPTPAAARTRRAITPGPAELPGDLARGRGGRTYPPLRGGLVKLAHDDPTAAARLIVGLAPALHATLKGPVALDLTLADLGSTVGIDAGADTTNVNTVAEPRGRRNAKVDVRTDAVTLAETLAGVDHQPRRRGVLRAVRGRRKARVLVTAVTQDHALPDLVRAGARLEPELALKAFAYAVPPAWTKGHDFAVLVSIEGATVTLRARDGAGLAADPADASADVALSLDRAGFNALMTDPREQGSPAEAAPIATLRDWAQRLGALPS